VDNIPGEFDLNNNKSRLKLRSWWVLEGGVGGLAGGWAFGGDLQLVSKVTAVK
jgi:hypothetical protein